MEIGFKKSNFQKGFTLIELLLVIGLLAIVGFTSLGPLSNIRAGIDMDNAKATVLQALEESRNKAVTGIGKTAHGVVIEDDKVIIFEGDSYTGAGIEKELPSNITSDQTSTEIVFSRLTGESSAEETVTLTHENGESASINVTYEGIISQ